MDKTKKELLNAILTFILTSAITLGNIYSAQKGILDVSDMYIKTMWVLFVAGAIFFFYGVYKFFVKNKTK